MSHCEFLLEVLCEEIPANALPGARRQLRQGLLEGLEAEGLTAAVEALSTVRRLALVITGLPRSSPDREMEVHGPPVKAAYAADGSPTPAALGFARAQGVAVESLAVVQGPRGQVLAARKTVKGRTATEVLGELCTRVIPALHFPKTMRWGSGEFAFVRPVHRITAIFWSEGKAETVPLELFGVRSGSVSLGHRVIAPGPVPLGEEAGAVAALARLARAGVILDVAERRRRLEHAAAELSAEVSCAVRPDPVLLDELVELVEFPGLVRGAVESRFLDLPEEVLVATLRHHQKCLVLMQDEAVAPGFLAVCDRDGDEHGWVRQGNEWVAGARLTDAEFFFAQDRRRPLVERVPDLERVIFHQRLGSFAHKVGVVKELAVALASQVPEVNPATVRRACDLLKCDLTTAMVGEFPELQGVMGGIYARRDGESEAVWQAVADQYIPAGLDGSLPRNPVAALVGVADRLDTLAALFTAGEVPSGSRDPFALRRAALGAVRICAGAPLELDLKGALRQAFELRMPDDGASADGWSALEAFFLDRVRHYLTSFEGVGAEVVDAVLSAEWTAMPDVVERVRALHEIRQEPVFGSLAVAFKRVRNMLAKSGVGARRDEVLREPAEQALAEALDGAEKRVGAALSDGAVSHAFRALSVLADPLDRFFEDVMVLCEDEALREARLGLLARVEALFVKLADLSRLAGAAGQQ